MISNCVNQAQTSTELETRSRRRMRRRRRRRRRRVSGKLIIPLTASTAESNMYIKYRSI